MADGSIGSLTRSAESDLFDEEYQQQILAWAMEQVRHEFHTTTWQAFIDTSVNGRTIPDVSRELGMSPGSIYVARSRIIARLRAKVAECEEDL
ncbi:MAG: sigma-70 family RNA polymerase sigma factor [Planctomycetes bacterium]|nr:sigma-70 family RNA polymerase sigma factor [Planctomycetota bacterium]